MRKISSLLLSFGLILGVATFAFADERGPTPKKGGEPVQKQIIQQTTKTVFVPARHPYEGHSDFTHEYGCYNGFLGFPFFGFYAGFPLGHGRGFGVGIGF